MGWRAFALLTEFFVPLLSQPVELFSLQKAPLAQHLDELPNFVAEDQRARGSRDDLLHVQYSVPSVQAAQRQGPRWGRVKHRVSVMEGIANEQARTAGFGRGEDFKRAAKIREHIRHGKSA